MLKRAKHRGILIVLTKLVSKHSVTRGNVKVEDTHTNKEAVPINDALTALLDQLVGIVKGEYDKNPDRFEDLTVQTNVKNELGDALRSGTESFYRLGIEYVNRANVTNAFFTARDTDNIKIIANDSTNWILKKITDYFRREEEIQKGKDWAKTIQQWTKKLGGEVSGHLSIATANKLNSFSVDKNVKNIVTMTETRAINEGTRDKVIQLNNPGMPSVVVTKTAAKLAELNLSTEDIWSGGFEPAKFVPKKQLERRLFRQRDEYSQWGLWTTAEDDKVCFDYCIPLQGQTFNLLDPDIPIPGDLDHESHPHCRCRYILIDPENLAMSNVIWG